MSTELDVTEGLQFDKGYLSPYFVTDPSRWRRSSRTPYVLLRQRQDRRLADLLPLLEKVLRPASRC